MRTITKVRFTITCIIISTLLFALGSKAGNAQIYAVPVDKSVRIAQINSPPIIDGWVREQEWKGATLIDNFVPTHTGIGKPSEKMKAYLSYDDENLYLAVVCSESKPSGMKITKYERDSSVTSDDCIEVFFDINYGKLTYYHLAINPVSALYDASVEYKDGLISMDKSWDSNAKVKASIGENEWVAEVAIPFTSFGLAGPSNQACWGLNINRVQRRIREYISWSVTGGSFHQPKNFGRLIWGTDSSVRITDLDFSALGMGDGNRLSFKTGNNSDRERFLDAKLILVDVEQKVLSVVKKKLTLVGNSSANYFLEYGIPSFGDYFVKLQVAEEPNQLFIDDTYRISLPPPMKLELDQYAYYNNEEIKCELSLSPEYGETQETWLELRLTCFGDEGVEKPIKINSDSLDATVKIIKSNDFVADKAQVKFDPSQFKIGKYKLRSELKRREGTIYAQDSIFRIIKGKKAEESLPIKEVTIGKNNSLFVNGQPFFPNGLYHVPVLMYPEVKKQGFNAVQIQPQNLDEANKHGLKGLIVLYPGMTMNLDLIRKTVLAYKNHPAVLMWLLLDEPDINKGSPEIMMQAYRLIKALDPNHPVSFVLIKPSSFERYNDALDILTTDPYPIPFDSVTVVGKTVDEALKVTKDTKPICTVLQSFGRYSIWRREPTAYEARAMAYIALNRGVTAFSWYCLDDRPSWWLADSTQLWSFFKGLHWELEELTPIIAFSNRTASIECITNNSAVDFSARELDDTYYVFAVNTTNEKILSQFRVLDVEEGNVEVLFDNYSLRLRNGEWAEELEPLGVRVYRIAK